MSDLGRISDAIRDFSDGKRRFEEEFLANNKPIKEFSIERDGELTEYGIWQRDDEDNLMIMFKVDGRYRFSNKMFYDKLIVRELVDLVGDKNVSKHKED